MIFPSDPGESTLWIFDPDAFGAGPALVCHLFPSAVGRLLEQTPHQAAQVFLGLLSDAMGSAAPADLDLLGEPVGGRLLFAGEHTQSARTGYADGAMTSGVREAKRLLHQPSVHFGARG
jgi:hypothetical protein